MTLIPEYKTSALRSFMEIDLYSKAVHLLEKVANSVHERNPMNPNLMCFTVDEVQVVEQWLKDFVEETQK